MRRYLSVLLTLLAGCTVVNVASVPTASAHREVFITSGDLQEPYESVGLLQVTRKGIRLFGAIDFAGTDLNAGFQESVLRIREMGGDGMINVHWHQTQYTLPTQFLGLADRLAPAARLAGEHTRPERRGFGGAE